MFKRLFVLCLMITTLFGQDEFEEVKQLRELTSDNFSRATARNIVVVEFYATWNEMNKVTLLDTWDTFDAKVYRINIDLYPDIQANNNVVILPTIIFYDEGEEVKRLQGDMSFTLKTTIEELDNIVEEILSSKF
jgi:thioredoxin-like negative regulator of GroEL